MRSIQWTNTGNIRGLKLSQLRLLTSRQMTANFIRWLHSPTCLPHNALENKQVYFSWNSSFKNLFSWSTHIKCAFCYQWSTIDNSTWSYIFVKHTDTERLSLLDGKFVFISNKIHFWHRLPLSRYEWNLKDDQNFSFLLCGLCVLKQSATHLFTNTICFFLFSEVLNSMTFSPVFLYVGRWDALSAKMLTFSTSASLSMRNFWTWVYFRSMKSECLQRKAY